MSKQYDEYLLQHRTNVKKGFEWIRDNLPELLEEGIDYEYQIGFAHDLSKDTKDEYYAYDAYFYGGNKSYAVVQEFKKAWLSHIHRNSHHWQHWVLINDDPSEGIVVLDMPDNYIIEMICDWWAFSLASGNLYEIFKWYAEHAEHMKLSIKTRASVESILEKIKDKLEVLGNDI